MEGLEKRAEGGGKEALVSTSEPAGAEDGGALGP